MSDPVTHPPSGGCDRTRITAYVDDALPAASREEAQAHLAGCAACRDQEAFERGLRERLRALPAPEMPAGLEDRVRRRLRHRPLPRAVRWLPLAAVLALAVAWGRGAPRFVAWELSRDHAHCFRSERLPAELWTSDAREATYWYRERGTELPLVPERAAGLELVGGRFCPLLDRRVAHLYYSAEKKNLSLFVVPGPARFGRSLGVRVRGRNVRLLRTSGVTVAVVSEDAEAAEAFSRALLVSVARALSGAAGPAALPDGTGLRLTLLRGL